MAYCEKCGNQLEDNSTTCSNCSALQSQQAVQQQHNETINVFGKAIKASIVIKCIAVILCLFFFLPMFSVSCASITINFSGFDSTFGKTIMLPPMQINGESIYGERESERIDGNILAIFLFLIPAALFVAHQFKNNISVLSRNLFKFSTVLSGLGFLNLIFYAIGINNKVANQMPAVGSPDFSFWYYISFFLYIISAVISSWCIVTSRHSEQIKDDTPG